MKIHYVNRSFILSLFFLLSLAQGTVLAADTENTSATLSAIYLLLLSSDESESVSTQECDSSAVIINYNDDSVTVNNPYEDSAVSVEVNGTDVTVTSSSADVAYCLTGTASDGMFKLYSDNDLTLQLNGVQITNNDGPAINIQSEVTASVELVSDTSSTLTDGTTYAESSEDEDQKGAFFSEGQLIFSGDGSLSISGQGDDQHALASDDQIVVNSGNISITDSVKDGIHTNDGYSQLAGSLEITAGGDGIDGGEGLVEVAGGTVTVLIADDDNSGIKTDGELTLSGGTINLTIIGDQSKGLKADGDINLTGGVLTIETSGGVVLEESDLGSDPSYCTAIKTDGNLGLDGADVSISTTGEAGRGISAEGDVDILSGQLVITSSGDGGTYTNKIGELDSFHGPCIKVDGSMNIEGGTLDLSHSGTGGRGISVDIDLTIGTEDSSPTVDVTTSGQEIYVSADDATEAKAIKVDNWITITNGNIAIISADDGIKSEVGIEINGGLIDILDAVEGLEAIYLNINDGELYINTTDDGMNATIGGETESDDDGSELNINGGYIYISSSAGDCMDSNGTIDIGGGTIILHGPPSIQPPDGSLDANGDIRITGGFLVAAEVLTMVSEIPDSSTGQNTVVLSYSSFDPRRSTILPAGTLFHIEDNEGNDLLTFAPEREYSKILISSPEIETGNIYHVYIEGSSNGTEQDGFYIDGIYSPGTQVTSFTSTAGVQQVILQ